MRALHAVLVVSLWLGSIVQAYANTQFETHCRQNGHASLTAPDGAHDPVHAAHHAGGGATPDGHAMDHGPASDADAGPCDCGCLCGSAGAIGAALLPTVVVALPAAPDHIRTVLSAGHAHAEHPAPQRPPAAHS